MLLGMGIPLQGVNVTKVVNPPRWKELLEVVGKHRVYSMSLLPGLWEGHVLVAGRKDRANRVFQCLQLSPGFHQRDLEWRME